MQINQKTFLITGAGGGIGGALALAILNEGGKVIALDLRQASLAKLSTLAGKKAKNLTTFAIDITNQIAINKLSKVINQKHKIDGLINSAGIIQPFIKINKIDQTTIERVINVNFYGTLNIIKAFLPDLLKRPAGYIANISSMGGFLPVPGQSLYGASKAAVKLMTEALYAELKDSRINVSVIFPGAINTNITKNSGISIPNAETQTKNKIKMTEASRAAQIIIKGIKKNKYQIYVGQDAKIMNLLYRLSPRLATDLIAKQMKSLLDK